MNSRKMNGSKQLKVLMLGMFCSIGAYGQNENFSFTYGGKNYDTEGLNLKVAKDRSIITASNWHNTVFAEVNSIIVHKTSSKGKLLWKTILECEEATASGLYELSDSSVVVLADVFKSGEKSIQLIKLNKGGTLVANKGYSNKTSSLSAAALVGGKNCFYALSNDYDSNPISATIQKFDYSLNKLGSVTLNDINITDGVFFENSLLITGYRDTASFSPEPALIKLDSSLNVLASSFYNITNTGYIAGLGTKIIIDQNKPIVVGSYMTASGLAKMFYIYPDRLSSSKYVSGDFISDLTFKNNSLYIAASLDESVAGADCYIAKYDPNTEVKKWIKGYGGSEADQIRSINFDQNKLYGIGSSQSYSNRTSTRGFPVREAYVLQTDSMGNAGCITDIRTENISLSSLKVDQLSFVCAKFIDDTVYNNVCIVVSPEYYDSLVCFSEATEIKVSKPNVFNVYPSITRDKVNIDVAKNDSKQFFELININGQRIASGSLVSAKTELDLSNQPNGLYLVRVFDESARASVVFKIHKISE
jgi:hypothetical protein